MKSIITSAAILGVFLLCCDEVSAQAVAQPKAEPQVEPAWRTQLTTQRASLVEKREEIRKRVESLRSELKDKRNQVTSNRVSDIAFEDVFRMLHLQNAELSIDLQGLEAKLRWLKDAAVKRKDRTEDAIQSQREILRNQLRLLEERMEQARQLVESGLRETSSVSEAEIELSKAKLQLQRFEANARNATGSLVEATFQTSLEIAEKKARLEAVTKMLDSHRKTRDSVLELSDLESKLQAEREEYQTTLFMLRDVEQQLEFRR